MPGVLLVYRRQQSGANPSDEIMKILVSTKRVPDPDQRIRVKATGSAIEEDGLKFVINPFDAIALEEGLRIRERFVGTVQVAAVGIGVPAYETELRTALAMGADRALHITCEAALDPWNVARLLAALVDREQPDLILMGKQAIDDDANQAGQFLAALLNWPQATFASRIEIDAGISGNGPATGATVRVARETDAGLETVRLRLPAVITTDLRLNEPRYASLPSIMKVRKKPIERLSAETLGVTLSPRVKLLQVESTSSQRKCVRVKNIDELVHRLRHEAGVI
jgi:electron transfer flavoprotein beta subunit